MFIQGHSAPGVYARAFMLGRLTEEQLDNFRQEVDGKGISSYPHPWLMPDFWQFPTVSMGLGPLMAIYQARFMKYLHDRGIAEHRGPQGLVLHAATARWTSPSRWARSAWPAREKLDNLIFVVNCNLQRLDGPVRGNGKIIQELESDFRGAGWNVIKVIWGRHWDPLFARDKKGILMRRMMECVDGEYQTFKSKDGAYVREYFFNTPELKELVADWSDDDIWKLNRGGHDPYKVYAAYHAAINHKGQPTVILAKTIKGYGMGESGEAQNITHQQKKMSHESIRNFRDRFHIPVPDEELDDVPYVTFAEDSPGVQVHARSGGMELGGYLPTRRAQGRAAGRARARRVRALPQEHRRPRDLDDDGVRADPAARCCATRTSASTSCRSCPTSRAPSAWKACSASSASGTSSGQLYTPQDADQLMFYKESKDGQILQEGINEAGGDVRLDRRRDVVLDARRADDPVLHLLLDVRLPARRRPRLGGGRHALARLPAGRHRRAHHAQRRRPAARGRPLARLCRRRSRTACRTTRPSATRSR